MLRAIVVVTALLLPTIGSGADFELSLGAAAEYDSNAFRISDDSDRSKKDDVIFRIVPKATLVSDKGSFTYRLRYSVPFSQGVDSRRDISDFDQIGVVDVGYRLNDATQFSARNALRYSRSHSRAQEQETAAGDFVPDVNNERSRILRNSAEIGVTHTFAPRLAGSLRVSHALFDTEQDNRADNWTISGTGSLRYQLEQKHSVGGGASITYQTFDDLPGLPGSDTIFYNIFLSWVYLFDETTTISINAGPVIITSDQDAPPDTVADFATYPFTVIEEENGEPSIIGVSNFANCPPVPGAEGSLGFLSIVGGEDPGCGSPANLGQLDRNSSDPAEVMDFETVLDSMTTLSFPAGTNPGSTNDTTVSAFGMASITKRWTPTLTSEAFYRRQQSAASGIGGSTIMDAVAFTTFWQISELWDASVRVDWSQRKSVSDNSLTQSTAVVAPGDLNTFAGVAMVTGTLTSMLPVRNEVNTQRWGVGMRLGREITRNLEASLRLNYNKQSSKSRTRGNSSDFDNYLAIIGIRYSFHPLELW